MYKSIISQLKTIFESIDVGTNKKLLVYPYPLEEGTKPTRYPALVFFPDPYRSEISSTDTTFKQIRFKAVLVITAEGIDMETLFTDTLPSMADKLLKKIDSEWNGVELEDAGRVWIQSDVGNWGIVSENKGRIAFLNTEILCQFNIDDNRA